MGVSIMLDSKISSPFLSRLAIGAFTSKILLSFHCSVSDCTIHAYTTTKISKWLSCFLKLKTCITHAVNYVKVSVRPIDKRLATGMSELAFVYHDMYILIHERKITLQSSWKILAGAKKRILFFGIRQQMYLN